jgi:hypothetical protein
MKTGHIIINDPDFYFPLYYIKEDDCLANHAGPLINTTLSKDKATVITEDDSVDILKDFYNSYFTCFGYNTLTQIEEDGISIKFVEGE